MLESLLILLVIVGIALVIVAILLARQLRLLMMSVECLCNNLGGLRAQIGHGEH
jgi:hypothetical protein